MPDFDPKIYCRSLTQSPGVYRMFDEKGSIIYVGKASNLKKRVGSYFGRSHDSGKTRSMVSQINSIEVTVTNNEGEALLLESNLIKEYKPRYNIIFRDDKSYPYLHFSTDHEFPQLSFYRGARTGKGRYFGPYPSAGAARQTLNLAQKIFNIRQCDDSFFRNRARPCLQYQINRCSAPCVGYISREDYARSVEHTSLFLEGKNEDVIRVLTEPMQLAADKQEFERAASYRDQIIALRRILEQQHVTIDKGEMDILGCSMKAGVACVQIFIIRDGRNLGNKTVFPEHTADTDVADVLSAFISQYYLAKERHIPPEILISHNIEDVELLEKGLSQQADKKIKISQRVRGERAKWLKMALTNAEIALQQKITSKQSIRARLEALTETLKFDEVVERIECFDISHTGGEAAVASCVVYGTEGAVKSDYRRFNIENIEPGDDYAAMKQVIERRYTRIRKEEGKLPDLILIDGGKGQLGCAREILMELQLGDIPLIGVAKGPTRRPGMEKLVISGSNATVSLAPSSPVLHLIQEIRDEAHRFAITGHRQRRARNRSHSPLEQIQGVGHKRRQQLIRYFGGIQGVEKAGIEDLVKVPGINKNLAHKIYNSFHRT